jgi:hypothetical protein
MIHYDSRAFTGEFNSIIRNFRSSQEGVHGTLKVPRHSFARGPKIPAFGD